MASIERVEFNGHNIWPNATSLTPYAPGLYFYMVALNYSAGPGAIGNMSSSGLVEPRHGSQYGELVTDVLEYVRRNCPGAHGGKVVTFFNIVPNGQFTRGGYGDHVDC